MRVAKHEDRFLHGILEAPTWSPDNYRTEVIEDVTVDGVLVFASFRVGSMGIVDGDIVDNENSQSQVGGDGESEYNLRY